MRKGTTPQQFTEEEKKAILYDYFTSGLSQRAIAYKYKLGDRSMLSNWLRKYKSEEKLLPLSAKGLKNMAKRISKEEAPELQLAQYKKELADLRAELYSKDMQLKALNALIDVAEEHEVKVRKNSGAKQ